MDEFGRRALTTEERQDQENIERSLRVTSYLDDVLEAIHSGTSPKVNVPNYRQPTKGELRGKAFEVPSETYGFHMNLGLAPQDDIPQHSEDRLDKQSASPKLVISRNQATALRRYPTLIEFLGQSEGETVAKEILERMNVLIADSVNKNSREANPHAIVCKADKQNLKEYFQGDDWLCRVTASGPFRGDEAIYYSREHDLACVLRKNIINGEVKYANVSNEFNLIYEAEEGDISSEVEHIIQDSVDKTILEESEEI